MNEGTHSLFFHHQTLFIMQKLLCILMNTLCLPWSNKDETNLCMTTAALQRSKRIKCKLLYGDDRMWHLRKSNKKKLNIRSSIGNFSPLKLTAGFCGWWKIFPGKKPQNEQKKTCAVNVARRSFLFLILRTIWAWNFVFVSFLTYKKINGLPYLDF